MKVNFDFTHTQTNIPKQDILNFLVIQNITEVKHSIYPQEKTKLTEWI